MNCCMFMSGVWIWIFFYLACLGINLTTWQCMRLSSTATMEVQQATELELPSESWSWAEVAVVLGWSFWLLMFCMGVACSCSKLCLWCHPLETHRGRRLAGDKAKKDTIEASAQTILCSPPNFIGEPTRHRNQRPTTPEPRVVYSTFKRGGQNALLQDMVTRALPVVEHVDKRRLRAETSEW